MTNYSPFDVNLNVGLLKDGKLYCDQPPLRTENHPDCAHDIIAYRHYRKHIENMLANGNTNVNVIPDEYTRCLCMLIEDSDESLPSMVNRLNELLSPFNRNEHVAHIFFENIEARIRSLAMQTKYGLDIYDQDTGTCTGPAKSATSPSHLSVLRWETIDVRCTPLDFQETVLARRNGRRMMVEHLAAYYKSLSQQQRDLLVCSPRQRKNGTQAQDGRQNIKILQEQAVADEKQKKKVMLK
ncbi:hypothetical protein DM01DRAFT_1114385 [Hesseltinella vesiculosa]|uniref:Uncharacterized protein n=1 Tax=Hesseltinella vesiculosa TaxID=101127 RepID=A0A1X2GA28_9FUNG|nr:hypothetical protein DM01DRAFT_1114385 [Hesseltinella vesiculosa]